MVLPSSRVSTPLIRIGKFVIDFNHSTSCRNHISFSCYVLQERKRNNTTKFYTERYHRNIGKRNTSLAFTFQLKEASMVWLAKASNIEPVSCKSQIHYIIVKNYSLWVWLREEFHSQSWLWLRKGLPNSSAAVQSFCRSSHMRNAIKCKVFRQNERKRDNKLTCSLCLLLFDQVLEYQQLGQEP